MFVVTSIYHDIFYLSFVLYLHLGVVNHLIVLVCHENVHVAETLESTDFIASYAQTTSEIFQKREGRGSHVSCWGSNPSHRIRYLRADGALGVS